MSTAYDQLTEAELQNLLRSKYSIEAPQGIGAGQLIEELQLQDALAASQRSPSGQGYFVTPPLVPTLPTTVSNPPPIPIIPNISSQVTAPTTVNPQTVTVPTVASGSTLRLPPPILAPMPIKQSGIMPLPIMAPFVNYPGNPRTLASLYPPSSLPLSQVNYGAINAIINDGGKLKINENAAFQRRILNSTIFPKTLDIQREQKSTMSQSQFTGLTVPSVPTLNLNPFSGTSVQVPPKPVIPSIPPTISPRQSVPLPKSRPSSPAFTTVQTVPTLVVPTVTVITPPVVTVAPRPATPPLARVSPRQSPPPTVAPVEVQMATVIPTFPQIELPARLTTSSVARPVTPPLVVTNVPNPNVPFVNIAPSVKMPAPPMISMKQVTFSIPMPVPQTVVSTGTMMPVPQPIKVSTGSVMPPPMPMPLPQRVPSTGSVMPPPMPVPQRVPSTGSVMPVPTMPLPQRVPSTGSVMPPPMPVPQRVVSTGAVMPVPTMPQPIKLSTGAVMPVPTMPLPQRVPSTGYVMPPPMPMPQRVPSTGSVMPPPMPQQMVSTGSVMPPPMPMPQPVKLSLPAPPVSTGAVMPPPMPVPQRVSSGSIMPMPVPQRISSTGVVIPPLTGNLTALPLPVSNIPSVRPTMAPIMMPPSSYLPLPTQQPIVQTSTGLNMPGIGTISKTTLLPNYPNVSVAPPIITREIANTIQLPAFQTSMAKIPPPVTTTITQPSVATQVPTQVRSVALNVVDWPRVGMEKGSYTVAELKVILNMYGQKQTGNKADLVNRLLSLRQQIGN